VASIPFLYAISSLILLQQQRVMIASPVHCQYTLRDIDCEDMDKDNKDDEDDDIKGRWVIFKRIFFIFHSTMHLKHIES
jgi:hypothetical protein